MILNVFGSRLSRQEDDLGWKQFYQKFHLVWKDLKPKGKIATTCKQFQLKFVKPKPRKRKMKTEQSPIPEQVRNNQEPTMRS